MTLFPDLSPFVDRLPYEFNFIMADRHGTRKRAIAADNSLLW
ncbi:hypothetical protein [Ensifer canadensis]